MRSENHGPAVERALLCAELRRLRSKSEETQEAVATACEWSVAKFSRIENGLSSIRKADLESLLRHYGVDDDHIQELIQRAREARVPGWWEDYDFGSDRGLEAYIGYEDGASSIRTWQPLAIPGLLQTTQYTEQIMEAKGARPEAIDRGVKLAQERQRRVAARKPEQYYLLDEAVIRRPASSVMSEQLCHLAYVARKPAVTIGIIPFSRGPHFGLSGPFVLLSFDSLLDTVLYVENARRGDLLIAETRDRPAFVTIPKMEDPADEVARYEDGFNGLQKLALDPAQSSELIERTAEELAS